MKPEDLEPWCATDDKPLKDCDKHRHLLEAVMNGDIPWEVGELPEPGSE